MAKKETQENRVAVKHKDRRNVLLVAEGSRTHLLASKGEGGWLLVKGEAAEIAKKKPKDAENAKTDKPKKAESVKSKETEAPEQEVSEKESNTSEEPKEKGE